MTDTEDHLPRTGAEGEVHERIAQLRYRAGQARARAEGEQDQADRSRQLARDLDAQATSWELLLEAAERGSAAAVREPDAQEATRSEGPHSRACGIIAHHHGEQCARDCPSCSGTRP